MVGDRMDTDIISGMESGDVHGPGAFRSFLRDTLKTYAYRPSIVLNGVGDIAAAARASKKIRDAIFASPFCSYY